MARGKVGRRRGGRSSLKRSTFKKATKKNGHKVKSLKINKNVKKKKKKGEKSIYDKGSAGFDGFMEGVGQVTETVDAVSTKLQEGILVIEQTKESVMGLYTSFSGLTKVFKGTDFHIAVGDDAVIFQSVGFSAPKSAGSMLKGAKKTFGSFGMLKKKLKKVGSAVVSGNSNCAVFRSEKLKEVKEKSKIWEAIGAGIIDGSAKPNPLIRSDKGDYYFVSKVSNCTNMMNHCLGHLKEDLEIDLVSAKPEWMPWSKAMKEVVTRSFMIKTETTEVEDLDKPDDEEGEDE